MNTNDNIKSPSSDNDKVEKCVFCNTNTEYKLSTHVDFRNYYIEGVGQLCEICYKSIYKNIC